MPERSYRMCVGYRMALPGGKFRVPTDCGGNQAEVKREFFPLSSFLSVFF